MMQPLSAFPIARRARIRVVFTDIDDTLSTAGVLTAEAYSAMERLQQAGIPVIPITGRPAGWCDHIARMWPVAAVVGENGAFYFHYDRVAGRLRRRFLQRSAARASARRRLDALRERILHEVTGTAVASDQPYREADLAIDYCEDVTPLPLAQAERIVQIAVEAGASARISSIHVNIWFGDYSKLSMTRMLMQERFEQDIAADASAYVFVGDSPNDVPMFEFFPNSVGVANVREFVGRMQALPAYVTERRGGAGFAQLAASLIEARNAKQQ